MDTRKQLTDDIIRELRVISKYGGRRVSIRDERGRLPRMVTNAERESHACEQV